MIDVVLLFEQHITYSANEGKIGIIQSFYYNNKIIIII